MCYEICEESYKFLDYKKKIVITFVNRLRINLNIFISQQKRELIWFKETWIRIVFYEFKFLTYEQELFF